MEVKVKVEVRAEVEVEGNVDMEVMCEEFTPELALLL